MKWIRQNCWDDLGGRACAGTYAYISEDGTMAILKLNFYFDTKTPWMVRELRNGNTYYLDRTIMENCGLPTLKKAKAYAEEYIQRKQEMRG